jgi:hypothetical protein
MRKATKTVATWLSIVAGIAGLEHGYFETLQGNTRPASLAFPSWGPQQCNPGIAWHACEPAMSILPNFLITGILTILLSLAVIIWAVWFLERKQGGLVLILLAVSLLLFGGGFFPPLIAIVGGIAGTQVNRPLNGRPGRVVRFTSTLWPWPLAILVIVLLGQFPVGYFFNEFLKSIMYFVLVVILIFLPLSVYTGYARDAATE